MSEKCKCPPPGAPGWIVTFADLMSILLTFFILILSFSVQDEEKFYDMVGSVRDAFGTQNDIIFAGMVELFGNPYNEFALTMVPVPIAAISLPDVGEGAGYGDQPLDDDMTVGNPLAEREDMPSAPFVEETEEENPPPEDPESKALILKLLHPESMFDQGKLFAEEDSEAGETDDSEKPAEQVGVPNGPVAEALQEGAPPPGDEIDMAALTTAVEQEITRRQQAADAAATNQTARIEEALAAALADELEGDVLSIEGNKSEITIRFPDAVAFGSGSDILKDSIAPTLSRVAEVLAETKGQIMISGHTDSIPISTSRFRSNWDLSTARAVSVIDRLEAAGSIARDRMAAVGYADTRPLAPQDTSENRALNRRVEITLRMLESPPADANDNPIP